MNNPKFGKYSQKMYKKWEKNPFWIAELLNHDGKKAPKPKIKPNKAAKKCRGQLKTLLDIENVKTAR